MAVLFKQVNLNDSRSNHRHLALEGGSGAKTLCGLSLYHSYPIGTAVPFNSEWITQPNADWRHCHVCVEAARKIVARP